MSPVLIPIVVPMLAAAATLAAGRRPAVQRLFGLAGPLSALLAGFRLLGDLRGGGVQVVALGAWPAPFGIVLVADLASVLMVLLSGVVGLAVMVHSWAGIERGRAGAGFYPIAQVMMAGVCGAFFSGDLFNLYVWFEVLLIASFVLMTLGGERAQMEGALKYVALNLLSSALFLAAVGLLYGITGTLNIADLSGRLDALPRPGLRAAVLLLLFVAFGIKAAVFPLFFWLPASYHTPPAAVSALFAGLLTKVGVFSILRVATLLASPEDGYLRPILLAVAAATMITGVFGAVAQHDLRRILAFHSVSQVGYMLFGVALGTPLGYAAALFFMVHHGIVKSNLFLVGGLVLRLRGTTDLKALGGLYGARPLLSGIFLVTALSLAGIPPAGGFFAKLGLIRAGIDAGDFLTVGAALGVGILTLLSMTKIWNEAFWKEAPAEAPPPASPAVRERFLLGAPAAALAAATLAMGLWAGSLLDLALEAGRSLQDRKGYVRAVLGELP
jgi:multicomponent Na+:H+ antiporter subunit D